jgi:RimJ/RimL family protein N-acetyltransferase
VYSGAGYSRVINAGRHRSEHGGTGWVPCSGAWGRSGRNFIEGRTNDVDQRTGGGNGDTEYTKRYSGQVNEVGSPVNSVETARLLMRVPELSDAEALMGIFWDPEVVERKQVTLREPPGGLDRALKNTGEMVAQWELRGYGYWSVIEKTSGDVIGCVGFFDPPGDWPGVDLGWLIHRSRWGHGFATEAATAALAWVWQYTQLDRIVSLIAPHDLRSIRIATKIGQRFERADVDPVHGEPVHVYTIARP